MFPRAIALHARRGLFNDPTARKFLKPILKFWKTGRMEPSSKDLLAVEREAILTVGVEADLRNLATCRRKALEGLGSKNREEYINLLISLGACYRKEGELEDAQRLLQGISLVEPGNWLVKAELGIVCGLRGKLELSVRYFKEADSVLEAYDREYEVEVAERWEAASFRARFEALLAIENDKGISQARLSDILAPVLTFPEGLELNGIKQFFYQKFERAFIALLQSKAPFDLFFNLFYRGIKGEKDGVAAMASGEWPVDGNRLLKESQMVVLKVLTKSEREIDAVQLKDLFGAEKDSKSAITVYVRMRVRALLGKGRLDAACVLWQEVKNNKLVSPAVLKALRSELRAGEKKLRQDAVMDQASEFLRQLEFFQKAGNEEKLLNEHGKLADQAARLLEVAEEETKDAVREALIEFVEFNLRTAKTLQGAVLLADRLIEFGDEIAQGVKKIFNEKLSHDGSRKLFMAGLASAKVQVISLGTMLAKGNIPVDVTFKAVKISKKKSLKIPNNAEFNKVKRFFDFFFVRFREHPRMRTMAGKIDVPFAEPISMESFWFCFMAAFDSNIHDRTHTFELALRLDPNNVVAKMEIARQYLALKQAVRAERQIDEVLEKLDHPAGVFKALTIKIMAVCQKLAAANVRGERLVGMVGENEKLFQRAEREYEKIAPELRSSPLIADELRGLNQTLGQIYTMARDFGKAVAYYDKTLESRPGGKVYELAMRAKTHSLLLEGKFPRAVDFLSRQIAELAKDVNRPIPASLYFYFAEAMFHVKSHKHALTAINRALGIKKRLDLILAKVRILAAAGKVRQAEMMLDLYAGQDAQETGKKGEEGSKFLRGLRALADAEIYLAKDRPQAAIKAFELAIKLFSGNYNTEFREIESRYYLVNLISRMAVEAGNQGLVRRAVEEGEKLLRKYPFFPPARQVMVGPLMIFGKESEALGHIQWLVKQSGRGVSSDILANLIISVFSENEAIQEKAIALFVQVRKDTADEAFPGIYKAAKQAVRLIAADWSEMHDRRLDDVLAADTAPRQ
ncbi:MAG: hypothetical protein U9R38_04620 [Candidatus Margulisiibacteriota bacterium]|nr:hypothetical protein [Candidatus Margulisiibacteriota bacterium]